VFSPLIDEILDAQTAERQAFVQLAAIGYGFGGCHRRRGRDGRFLRGLESVSSWHK
jgi:hypothetical protein